MNNKTYDILKWIALIAIPALATLVGVVGSSISWEQTEITVTIITAVGVFLGSILGVSTYKYDKNN